MKMTNTGKSAEKGQTKYRSHLHCQMSASSTLASGCIAHLLLPEEPQLLLSFKITHKTFNVIT